jgi:hypothetical protein
LNDGGVVGPDLDRLPVGEAQAVAGSEGRGAVTVTRVAIRAIRGSGTIMTSPRLGVSCFHHNI